MIGRLLGALFGIALLASACSSDLTSDPNGRPCSADGRCLPGYTCEHQSNRCLRSDASTGSANCQEGETRCGEQCVTLSEDPGNCGGCNTACSAPPHGEP